MQLLERLQKPYCSLIRLVKFVLESFVNSIFVIFITHSLNLLCLKAHPDYQGIYQRF